MAEWQESSMKHSQHIDQSKQPNTRCTVFGLSPNPAQSNVTHRSMSFLPRWHQTVIWWLRLLNCQLIQTKTAGPKLFNGTKP